MRDPIRTHNDATDALIYENVCSAFTGHADLTATRIDVTVQEGIVTLAGAVPSRYAKFLAENLAAATGGVIEVLSALHVCHAGGPA